jgi:hypothetical protein
VSAADIGRANALLAITAILMVALGLALNLAATAVLQSLPGGRSG